MSQLLILFSKMRSMSSQNKRKEEVDDIDANV